MKTLEEKILKQRAYEKRMSDRARLKANDPEVKAKKIAKIKARQQRMIERAKEKKITTNTTAVKATNKPRARLRGKGLKGRTPTAYEKAVMNAIGQLPCVCCSIHKRESPVISLHHIDGRTKPLAHAKVLPLCAYHHDTPIHSEYPDLIPFHAKGREGGKAAWIKQNGDPIELLKICYQLANIEYLFDVSY